MKKSYKFKDIEITPETDLTINGNDYKLWFYISGEFIDSPECHEYINMSVQGFYKNYDTDEETEMKDAKFMFDNFFPIEDWYGLIEKHVM